ncbi:hypothetical protein J2W92_002345 [Rhizobium leguminosarum]
MPVSIRATRRLDGETDKLLRDIVSDRYHRLAVTEADFDELEERPYFVRALKEKLIFISAPAEQVHVSIGIRKNGYAAIGVRARFTLVDFLDSVKSFFFKPPTAAGH